MLVAKSKIRCTSKNSMRLDPGGSFRAVLRPFFSFRSISLLLCFSASVLRCFCACLFFSFDPWLAPPTWDGRDVDAWSDHPSLQERFVVDVENAKASTDVLLVVLPHARPFLIGRPRVPLGSPFFVSLCPCLPGSFTTYISPSFRMIIRNRASNHKFHTSDSSNDPYLRALRDMRTRQATAEDRVSRPLITKRTDRERKYKAKRSKERTKEKESEPEQAKKSQSQRRALTGGCILQFPLWDSNVNCAQYSAFLWDFFITPKGWQN
jgi:hypothetical protein